MSIDYKAIRAAGWGTEWGRALIAAIRELDERTSGATVFPIVEEPPFKIETDPPPAAEQPKCERKSAGQLFNEFRDSPAPATAFHKIILADRAESDKIIADLRTQVASEYVRGRTQEQSARDTVNFSHIASLKEQLAAKDRRIAELEKESDTNMRHLSSLRRELAECKEWIDANAGIVAAHQHPPAEVKVASMTLEQRAEAIHWRAMPIPQILDSLQAVRAECLAENKARLEAAERVCRSWLDPDAKFSDTRLLAEAWRKLTQPKGQA